ncbi:MAG: hypothetical protein LBE36_06725 [Flavobacteriaceae bacterium]|jgi:hypothetical protein|nr:hypothetical protein [Flavobacteriaceae bacterium]
MRTITVFEKETGEKVTERSFYGEYRLDEFGNEIYINADEQCYDWFHENWGEEEYYYEKLG